MNRSKTTPMIVVGVLLLSTLIISSLVFPASAAVPNSSGHWIDNLGSGVTAVQLSDGNNHPDCLNPTFTTSDSDLWVFEISGASDPKSIPVWDGTVPAWTADGPVTVRDVTQQYGVYVPSPTTKRLYIETTPSGAELNAAHLLYNGRSTSEVLDHTCARGIELQMPSDLTITYDLTYHWAIDTQVEWKAVDAYTYDITYVAKRQRDEVPQLQEGSAFVRGTLGFAGPNQTATSVLIQYVAGDYVQDCSVRPEDLSFECPIDHSRVTVDPATGHPTQIGSINVSAQTEHGTVTRNFPVDWSKVQPQHIFRTDAVIRNHTAMVAHAEVEVSKNVVINFFRETWSPASNYCSSHTQIFELISQPSTSLSPENSSTTTFTWCRPRPGYSLQYLGGPYGIPMLVANVEPLRQAYPKALANLPPLTNRDEIRQFLGSLACFESCDALFNAQFLTAAFNALDPGFASQQIHVGDRCLTVGQYLQEVNDEAPSLDRAALVVRKSELERINGALVTTCPTVTTTNDGGSAAPHT